MTKTFYDVLGVTADATTDEIRDAYRERLKESHPDLSDDDDANEATRRIIRARDVLTDEDERERYDRVGHHEYVGNAESGVDDGDVSDAAAAARRAGWATGGSGDDATGAGRTANGGDSGPGGGRRARERRRRERAAREQVGREQDGREQDGRERTRRSTDETTGATDGTGATGANGTGATTTDGGSVAAASTGTGGVTGSARSWNGSGGYSVRQEYDVGPRRKRLIPTGKTLTLLVVAFVLYPLMLFSALFPPFPLVVNLIVGLCTIFLVGYLQSVPQVGVVVFGAWSLAAPLAFAVAGIPLTGLVGIAALAGTWLPFGLSAMTFFIVRP